MKTELRQYVFSRQAKLIMDLVSPAEGESLLDVDCGAGDYLRLFQQKKCLLTGIDSSASALSSARNQLDESCELVRGNAADLPFSDNEFDVVTLIHGSLSFTHPDKVLAEAIRVSRGRVFVGFFNKFSFLGATHSFKKLFDYPQNRDLSYFTVCEMQSLINKSMDSPFIQWGSVMYFPVTVYPFFSELEGIIPIRRNPLGAYVGMVFPVKYTYRTLQNPIVNSFEMKTKTQAAAPEPIGSLLRKGDR